MSQPDIEPRERLGAHLRRAREAAGLSLGQLAVMVGIEEEVLERFEASTDTPSRAALVAIAEALELPVDEFVIVPITVAEFRDMAANLLAQLRDDDSPRQVPRPPSLCLYLRIAHEKGWTPRGVVQHGTLEPWETPGIRRDDYLLDGAVLTQEDAQDIGRALLVALDEPAHTWARYSVWISEAVSFAAQLADAPPTGVRLVGRLARRVA